MRTFKDNAGRDWIVTINTTTIKRVRSLANIDLLTVLDEECKLLVKLHDDPVTLADVLFVACNDQAALHGVTDEQFGQALSGNCLQTALDALMDELADFFPDPRRRQRLRDFRAKISTMVDAMLDHAKTMIDGLDADAEAKRLIATMSAPAASTG
jgi:hypothetical protein